MTGGVTPRLWDLKDLLAWDASYSAPPSLNEGPSRAIWVEGFFLSRCSLLSPG